MLGELQRYGLWFCTFVDFGFACELLEFSLDFSEVVVVDEMNVIGVWLFEF